MKWSNQPPRKLGYYWYKAREENDPSIVRVYRDDAGELSIQYRDLDIDVDHECAYVAYLQSWCDERAQWAYIPEPR